MSRPVLAQQLQRRYEMICSEQSKADARIRELIQRLTPFTHTEPLAEWLARREATIHELEYERERAHELRKVAKQLSFEMIMNKYQTIKHTD